MRRRGVVRLIIIMASGGECYNYYHRRFSGGRYSDIEVTILLAAAITWLSPHVSQNGWTKAEIRY